jgi:shikimate 5-dehydrogenase
MDLVAACRDLFDEIDPLADQMAEVSSIYKRDGKLHGRTVDPVNSGRALDAFLPDDHWRDTGAEACILGAGGSSLALSWHLLTRTGPGNRPSRLVVTNRSQPRLDHMRAFHETLAPTIPIEYECCPDPRDNDAVVNYLVPRSLVVNATGLGKDAPGSPVTDHVSFPLYGYIWEFNYRGDLRFRDQAYAQKPYRHLVFEDGWTYFVHGWTSDIALVSR